MDPSVYMTDMLSFIVGIERTRISVHSGVISRLSPTLAALLDRPMKESLTKTVEWDDLKVEDVARFCQFAYTGDYSQPTPEVRRPADLSDEPSGQRGKSRTTSYTQLAVEEPEELVPEIAFEDIPEPTMNSLFQDEIETSTWNKKKKEIELSKMAILRKKFQAKSYGYQVTSGNNKDQIDSNNDPDLNFTPVFLGHAQLYVIGDKYGIEELTTLTLRKLYRMLSTFRLYEDRIENVVQLVRYAYEHTVAQDQLRKLVVEYLATEVDIFGTSAAFYDLLEEGGDFTVDFWKHIHCHLLSLH